MEGITWDSHLITLERWCSRGDLRRGARFLFLASLGVSAVLRSVVANFSIFCFGKVGLSSVVRLAFYPSTGIIQRSSSQAALRDRHPDDTF